MKKWFLISTMCLVAMALQAQNINGRIIDESAQPLPFANVVLLSLPDSTFIQGAVSDAEGLFSIKTEKAHGLLKVSSIGYVTQFVDCQGGNMGDITLLPDQQMLNEVVIKASRPTYKMTTEGIATNVENTVLSKAGTAEDVLSKIPGLTKKGEDFEVFGKGSPLIYINGREVRDLSELDQLKSEDIKNVEVITNPGSSYDASVKCVVKIRTKLAQGEGFGFDARSSYYQSENTDLVEQLNWNYRHNKLDVFGTLHYSLTNIRWQSTTTTIVPADTLWEQLFIQDNRIKSQASRNVIGANYAFNENHSIGFRYNFTLRPDRLETPWSSSDITANGQYFDHVENTDKGRITYRPAHTINAYYRGKIGDAEINFNTDYLSNDSHEYALFNEQSDSQESRIFTSENIVKNQLFASKLTVDYPLFGGNLTAGAEYTNTHRNDDYIQPENYVPTSFAKLEESNVAPFVEYSRETPIGQLSAGLRYEWVKFDYFENDLHIDEQSRSFGNLFPSFSFTTQIDQVQLQLSYAAKTRRPTYNQLSNNMSYGNRFLMQTGNPYLKHEYVHDLTLTGLWKFLQCSVSYNDRKDAIIMWSKPLEGHSSVIVITQTNIPSLKSVSAMVAVAPKFGIWSPQLTAAMEKQWFTLHTSMGDFDLNRPISQFSMDNSFEFGHGWVASIDAWLTTIGDQENGSFTGNTGSLNVSLTKTFFDDRLSIRCKATTCLEPKRTKCYPTLMESKPSKSAGATAAKLASPCATSSTPRTASTKVLAPEMKKRIGCNCFESMICSARHSATRAQAWVAVFCLLRQ